MPPIHMPAWPVSTTTMASSGTWRVSSAQMRSGRIGTASEVSAELYFAYHSLQMSCASSTQALRLPALARSACGQHARQHDLGVAVDGGLQRIVAAERLRIDVDLDRRRADLRHRPEMRGHAAGLGADEADEVGAVDDPVGALARIGADHADRQRMRAGDRVLAVERGRDRDLQRLGQRDQLGAARPRRARRRRRRSPAARPSATPRAPPARWRRRAPAGTAARARTAARTAAPSRPPRRRPGPRCRGTADAPGPGVPEVATRNACRTMSGKRATSSTVALNLVTGSNAGTSSISW